MIVVVLLTAKMALLNCAVFTVPMELMALLSEDPDPVNDTASDANDIPSVLLVDPMDALTAEIAVDCAMDELYSEDTEESTGVRALVSDVLALAVREVLSAAIAAAFATACVPMAATFATAWLLMAEFADDKPLCKVCATRGSKHWHVALRVSFELST